MGGSDVLSLVVATKLHARLPMLSLFHSDLGVYMFSMVVTQDTKSRDPYIPMWRRGTPQHTVTWPRNKLLLWKAAKTFGVVCYSSYITCPVQYTIRKPFFLPAVLIEMQFY